MGNRAEKSVNLRLLTEDEVIGAVGLRLDDRWGCRSQPAKFRFFALDADANVGR